MTKNQFDQLVKETKGKFFSVTFTKKDGSERTLNAKDFYARLQHGGKSTVEAQGYTSFVNRNAEAWACAKGERVKRFKCGAIQKTFWGSMVNGAALVVGAAPTTKTKSIDWIIINEHPIGEARSVLLHGWPRECLISGSR